MKILVTGATGFVGSKLIEQLFVQGFDQVNILTTNPSKVGDDYPFPVGVFKWDIKEKYIQAGAFDGVEAIIHLAGENVADGRWSESRKKAIYESRIAGTSLLIDNIRSENLKIKKFISSSAIGIYGDCADKEINESSAVAEDFLANVCREWENVVLNSNIENMKTVCLRTGIVLDMGGGALKKMLLPFKLGAGGKLGSGKQFMSWIHRADLVNMYIWALKNEHVNGIYNATAPHPETNLSFTKTLGSVLKRPTFSPAPAFILKLVFGEMSSILLGGQKVLPKRALDEGFKFQHAGLKEALVDILGKSIRGESTLSSFQWVPKSPQEVFPFFSEAKNLEVITPKFLNFKVKGMNTEKIQTGSLIDYSISLRGIPMRWQSRIEDFTPVSHFVDTQLKGPYKKWHHRHSFYPVNGGTLLEDEVTYKLPLGVIGNFFGSSFVKKDLKKIFNFRKEKINELFG